MKKLLALLLAMLVVTVLLAGCVGGDTTEPTNGPGLPSAPSGSDPTDPTYTTDPVTGERVLTRTDLQAAITELAWSYYTKGTWVQYDSMDLNTGMDGLNNPLTRWMGGHTRLDHFATSTLENATEHDTLYSVCSDFVWDVYYMALGYPIMGSSFNASTWYMWQYGENPDDMMVVRWHSWEEGTNHTETEDGFVTHDKCLAYDELFKFMENWEENLQAGDIIVWPGHAMLYVGNGYVLDCNGAKYNMKTGVDTVESSGAIRANSMYDLFFDPEMVNGEFLSYFYMENLLRREDASQFCILRPLDLLTKDDGDGNPANDVLDPDYELDLGEQNGKFCFDTVTDIKTSGYTITDVTYSRMKYPAMNINRTVNITPYGTAVKGDEITYTIEIINGTNDDNYIAWKMAAGDSWPFKTYKNLVVTETIPANTELVSAKGATIEGDTLRWEFNLVSGQSKKLTYTVKVTGDVGDQIVNGGGWVDGIPSNTLVNTIGGKGLSSDAVKAFWNLYFAGRDAWNSNDGYRISAGADQGTRFAERIYNEAAGLDLQLPDVQELMDMLFTQERIEVDAGMGGHFNNSVYRYMYTLNDTTDSPANQIYRDMVVDTFYGGVWVFSNPYEETPRTVEIRSENLQVGDILIMVNLEATETRGMESEDRDVKKWKIMVYMGNNSFAELTSESRLAARNSDLSVDPIFTYDMFVVLRPSQAYEDINTDVPAYTGKAPALTEKDMAYKFQLDVSNVLLNDELSQQLAGLTTDGCKMQNGNFIGEIYLKLKIDVVYNGTNDASYATVLKNVFKDISSSSAAYATYGHEYHLLSEPVENFEALYEMLLYYGGPAFATKNEMTSLRDLHPGDVIMTGLRNQRYYTVIIYQGDGKFLCNSQALEGTIFKENYSWYTLSFNNDQEFFSWLSGPIQPDVYANVFYEGYMVLRPSRAFDDINAMQLRDITKGELTQDEIDRLASLTAEDSQKVTYHLNQTGPWMYSMAYIDMSPYLDLTCYRTMEQIFTQVNGKWTLLGKSAGARYRAMLVEDYYGGTDFAKSRTFTADDFQIGDLFCAYVPTENGNRYYVAMYQGNGKFLMGATSGELYVDKSTVFSTTLATDFSGYYVLRPNQLAGFVEPEPETWPELTNKLTQEQMDAIAALTPADIKNKGWLVNELAPVIYNAAGLNVSNLFGTNPYTGKYLTNFNMGETLFKWSGAVRQVRPIEDPMFIDSYSFMLVSDYYGGTQFATSKLFTAADFEVGDLFVAYGPAADGSGNVYYTAVYQGNGKFLAIDQTGSSKGGSYLFQYDTETVFASDIATRFTMYYVLRPGYVLTEAPEEEEEVRPVLPNKLTQEQMDAIASVQPDDISKKVWLLDSFVPTVYKAANVDVSAYFGTNPVTGKTFTNFWMGEALFKWKGGVRAIRSGTDAEFVEYCLNMLVGDYYGGTEFATSKLFTAADFEVGDIFAAYGPAADGSGNVYYTAVYQGNGKFLAADQTGSSKGGDYVYRVDSETVFGTDIATRFNMYYVLRPGCVITDKDVMNQNTGFTLTESQQAVISGLQPSDLQGKAWYINSLAEVAYKKAGLDLTPYINKTNYYTIAALFKGSSGNMVPKTSADSDFDANLASMLVKGYYGGTEMKADRLFTAADFQIGDMFFGWEVYNGGNKYYTGIYVGNGTFLALDQTKDNYTNSNWDFDTQVVFGSNISSKFAVYAVLRPANFGKEDTQSGVLSQAQMDAISALKPEDIQKSVWLVNSMATEVYKAAGMDVSAYFGSTTHGNLTNVGMFNSIFRYESSIGGYQVRPNNYNGYIDYCHDMLVEGYYGGTQFAAKDQKTFVAEDFQIGDLFAGWVPKADGSGNLYYTGVYQGDGVFLVADQRSGTYEYRTDSVTVFDAQTLAGFTAYYVLRPGQLFD